MPPPDLFDDAGRRVTLGPKLGQGGEAAVFELAGAGEWVAKVYDKPQPATKGDKLRAMIALSKKELSAIAAWPAAVLSGRPGGAVVGLVMRRVTGFKEVHTLYSPAQRKVTFPRADWKFLAHVAANCAAAFHTAHAHGVVVGDVNQSNILVSDGGLVAFIDCDSFQLQAHGRTYPCEVGVPLYTPPELIGRPFRDVVRTAEHDRFGLAILLFQLLLMGRHPFSGRYAGSGDMPIEKAISEFRFAYGRAAPTYQMQPPLHALPLAALSPHLEPLFERAFGSRAPSVGRPAAAEWHTALTDFRETLRPCPRDPGHQTPAHHRECVWCELMGHGAPNFFISVAFSTVSGSAAAKALVLAAIWARIEAVPRPEFVLAHTPPPAGRAVASWPATLPLSIPPAPQKPAILTAPPQPPEAVLPPARYTRAVRPYTTGQRVAGYVFVATLTFFFPCYLTGSVLGSALGVSVKALAWVFGGLDLLTGLAAMAAWLVLEWERRGRQERANRLYRVERRERQRLAEDQLAAWERAIDQEVEAAEQQYRVARAAWERLVYAARSEAGRRRAAARVAAEAVESVEFGWVGRLAHHRAEFDQAKRELTRLRDRHAELAGQLAAEQQHLVARARDTQRVAFLQRHFIDQAVIPDIGPTRKATLASFGIETAFDVAEDAVQVIPGFGEKLTARLLGWRSDVEARFRFDPAAGAPEHERRALEVRYFQQRQPIETSLMDGERSLAGCTARARAEFEAVRKRIGPLLEAKARVDDDLSVIPSGI